MIPGWCFYDGRWQKEALHPLALPVLSQVVPTTFIKGPSMTDTGASTGEAVTDRTFMDALDEDADYLESTKGPAWIAQHLRRAAYQLRHFHAAPPIQENPEPECPACSLPRHHLGPCAPPIQEKP